MGKKYLHSLSALVLAIAFTGCQAASVIPEPQPEQEPVYAVVDSSAASNLPFAYEYPAIDADITLPGASGAASVQELAVAKAPAEVKSIWISYLEMQTLLKDKTAKQFRANIAGVFDNVKAFGLNTVVIQVRPFADALYQSDYFPWSYTITGTEGKDPGFDPLAVMVEEAKSRGLRIEAWVNPYRVRASGNTNPLSKTNQAQKWLDAKDDSVVNYDGVISYNPASAKAQKLIVNGIREIVKNYDVNGVHIDDYFYPSTDAAFDKAAYKRYTDGGGKLALASWRRSNVEKLIKAIYAAVKEENKNVLFGVSPQSSVANNYDAQYLDVKKIAGTAGYCDYVCPQIYFGFNNAVQPFKETLAAWDEMVTAPGVKLYVGLAAYKVGAPDSWAGDGKNEWLNNTNLLKRMVTEARACDNYGGIVIYRYDSLFNPVSDVKTAVQKEAKNLKEVLNQQ